MAEVVALDAHVHIGLEKYAPVERYVEQMDRLGLRHAVLVQYIGGAEDAYLAACLRRHPGRFAALGSVDPLDRAAVGRLAAMVEEAGFLGIRLAAGARTPGRDPWAVWRQANELGLIVSVRGPIDDIASSAFERIVRAFPGIRFRIEHLGWLKLAEEPPPYRRYRRVLRLASYPNTYLQWSGFYLNSTGPYPYTASREVVELAYRAFGADRTMWSGDWNRADISDTAYRAEIDLVGSIFPVNSRADRDRILWGTAATLFGLGSDAT